MVHTKRETDALQELHQRIHSDWERYRAMPSKRYPQRKLANNTYLRVEQNGDGKEVCIVKLHATDIIELHSDHVVLKDGGWQTITTRGRMNEYCPINVASTHGQWFVTYGTYQRETEERYPRHYPLLISEYFSGINIPEDLIHPRKGTAKGMDSLRLKEKINRYSKAFINHVAEHGIDPPGGGDCWLCAAGQWDESHLDSHIEESYFVPRLLYEATCANRGDPAACWHIWFDKKRTLSPHDKQYMTGQLRRYLKKQLGLPA